jgi:hypothetical protein
VSNSTLTEEQTLELTKLDILNAAGRLTDTNERLRWKALKCDTPARSTTLGARVVTSVGYKEFAAKALATNGNVSLSKDVPLASAGPRQTKTLLRLGSSTSAGAFTNMDDQRGEYAPVRRPLELLNLVRPGTTEESAVSYVRQTTYTSAAAETAEATSTTTGTKPEATLPFEAVSSPVENIPVWAPATRRALADVDELRRLVDEQLSFDVRRRLEEQLINGNGTTPNLRGILNTTGVQSQAKGADSHPLALTKAIALVLVAGFKPNAVAIHPNDWVESVTPFITAGGSLGETLTVPVVPSASVPEGTALVGDFNQAAVWTRSLDVYFSATHSDYLTRNLVACLAEGRFAVGVFAPAAFAKVTGV